jgi:hypothetical protein
MTSFKIGNEVEVLSGDNSSGQEHTSSDSKGWRRGTIKNFASNSSLVFVFVS